MIADIIVGYNHSRMAQVALEQALDIAQQADARIQLVNVAEQAEPDSEANLLLENGTDVLAYVDAPGDEEPQSEVIVPQFLEEARLRCQDAHVACSLFRFQGEASYWLRQRARLAQLVIVGRHNTHENSPRRLVGRTVQRLLVNPPVPVMVTGNQYRELAGGLLLYSPTLVGGRALNLGATLAGLLNASLDVVVAARDRHSGQKMVAEARFAARPYHLDGSYTYMPGSAAEVVLKAGMARHYDFVVVPSPPSPWWAPGICAQVKTALGIPDTVLVAVP